MTILAIGTGVVAAMTLAKLALDVHQDRCDR